MKANADDLFAGLGRKMSGAKAPLFEENTYHVFQILDMSVSKRRNRVVVEAKMVVEDGTIFIEKYYLHNTDGKQNYAATEAFSKLVEAALGIDLDNEMPTMKQVEKCEEKYIVTDVYHDQGDDGRVYDYDLKNAYPTAMAMVYDCYWDAPIAKTYTDCDLEDIAPEIFADNDPNVFMLAYISSFEFPENVLYPCIVVMVNKIPVYPLKYSVSDKCSEKVARVCVTGPELYLAYKLGAKIHIEEAYILNKLQVIDENDNIVDSKCLSKVVKQFVVDRTAAKNAKSKICDAILKVMINSMYGKIAQNVIAKTTYSTREDDMVDIGSSTITNPVLATFITAIVRCVLLATQNQLAEKGYSVWSTTTDGFISDADEATLNSLDLYGFAKLLYDARMYLTDNTDGSYYEVKHWQDELLNFTTRGNVSLRCNDDEGDSMHPDGVCAHCGIVTGKPKDSYEDGDKGC